MSGSDLHVVACLPRERNWELNWVQFSCHSVEGVEELREESKRTCLVKCARPSPGLSSPGGGEAGWGVLPQAAPPSLCVSR